MRRPLMVLLADVLLVVVALVVNDVSLIRGDCERKRTRR